MIGLGAIGLELGQAPHRLGVTVTGFDARRTVAGLMDPEVSAVAVGALEREFPIHLGAVADFAVDGSGVRMLLQDTADEGRAAGANAVREKPRAYPRTTPMGIVFADPNIAQVGARRDQVPAAIVGQQRFGPVGRALIMGRNRSLIRLYADRDSGCLLGAAMVGPRVEHLAHLVAWSVHQGQTVEHMLGIPFYHSVIEEVLQDALKDTARRLAATGAGATPPARAA